MNAGDREQYPTGKLKKGLHYTEFTFLSTPACHGVGRISGTKGTPLQRPGVHASAGIAALTRARAARSHLTLEGGSGQHWDATGRPDSPLVWNSIRGVRDSFSLFS